MNKVFFGDCRETMRALIQQGVKVQCCVTSPPYYGLRDYGHEGQIGLEETPADFVATMVDVFSLVYALLADDGILWLNLGDSYAGSGKGRNGDGSCNATGKQATNKGAVVGKLTKAGYGNCKPKDLIGIPWRVAFALQDAGWYLRQDIIWHKPNPMPESVTDRCTKSHEYIFMLTKNPRYYFDNTAIQEPCKQDWGTRDRTDGKYHNEGSGLSPHSGLEKSYVFANKRSVWTIPTAPYSGAHFATFPPALIEPCILAGSRANDIVFDPFFGSGTTGQVAQSLGRQWIGCELNQEYEKLQKERTAQYGMDLN